MLLCGGKVAELVPLIERDIESPPLPLQTPPLFVIQEACSWLSVKELSALSSAARFLRGLQDDGRARPLLLDWAAKKGFTEEVTKWGAARQLSRRCPPGGTDRAAINCSPLCSTSAQPPVGALRRLLAELNQRRLKEREERHAARRRKFWEELCMMLWVGFVAIISLTLFLTVIFAYVYATPLQQNTTQFPTSSSPSLDGSDLGDKGPPEAFFGSFT